MSRTPNRWRGAVLAAALTTGLAVAVAPLAPLAAAAVPLPPSASLPPSAPLVAAAVAPAPKTPSGLPSGIEGMGISSSAATCDPTAKPGAAKLAKLLVDTYPGTSAGVPRACSTDTKVNSEHMEGRAIDWMNSVRDPKQKAEADAVLKWLFATDAAGHTYANARRLGVMYIIWNNRIWGAYNADSGWRSYNNCAATPAQSLDSACHRNHIHISLTWAGAAAATSFWSKSVAATDYGPCRVKDLNWAASYTKANPNKCVRYAAVNAPSGASAAMKSLVANSGKTLKTGSNGSVVKTVQKIVGATVDGKYGAQTATKVKAWQSARNLSASGKVDVATWRALLKPPSSAPVPTERNWDAKVTTGRRPR